MLHPWRIHTSELRQRGKSRGCCLCGAINGFLLKLILPEIFKWSASHKTSDPKTFEKFMHPASKVYPLGGKSPKKGLPRKVAIRCMICQLNTRHSFAGIWWLLTAQRHFPTPTWTPINTTQFQWELVGFKTKSYMHIEKVFIL